MATTPAATTLSATTLSATRRTSLNRHAAIGGVMLLATCLAGAGINQHGFWDDEASTAMFATSLLKTGHLDAWDGRNLNAFRGGINLDAQLRSAEGIPLQHYAAAAGIELFGRSTWAARLPFLIAGVLTLWLLNLWAPRMTTAQVPSWLPPLLLACNVPYLLFITQCRYYALSMAFTVALLWAWSCLERPRRWPPYAWGAIAAAGLALSNPLNAVALIAACVVAALHPRYRSLQHVIFVAITGAVVTAITLHNISTTAVEKGWQPGSGLLGVLTHFGTLLLWQVQGLSLFGFVPVLLLPALFLPWIVGRLGHLRPAAARALTVFAMMLTILAVVAALSPQDPSITLVADMRYGIQTLVMGSLVTAVALVILATWLGRTAALAVAAVIVFTNLPYGARPTPQCVICERVVELLSNHKSGSDAVLAVTDHLPAGTRIGFVPGMLATSVMFYRPDLLFSGMLDPAKTIDPDLRETLPNYVFSDGPPPDVLVIGLGVVPIAETIQHAGASYRLIDIVKTSWIDRTRAELPWHRFRIDPRDDEAHAIAVFRRVEGP
jgi:hypothetical protein